MYHGASLRHLARSKKGSFEKVNEKRFEFVYYVRPVCVVLFVRIRIVRLFPLSISLVVSRHVISLGGTSTTGRRRSKVPRIIPRAITNEPSLCIPRKRPDVHVLRTKNQHFLDWILHGVFFTYLEAICTLYGLKEKRRGNTRI